MGIMAFSAMINVAPVPNFTADRPFLVAVIVDNVPQFIALYRNE